MNNLKKGVAIFLIFIVSGIVTTLAIVLGEGDADWIFGAMTLVVFCFMIWFFLTHDPTREEGGYQ